MGRIQGSDTGFGLTARHCMIIGAEALKTGQHALAVEWLELTKSLLPKQAIAEIDEAELDMLLLEAVTTVCQLSKFRNQIN